jgi:hypothetical protein
MVGPTFFAKIRQEQKESVLADRHWNFRRWKAHGEQAIDQGGQSVCHSDHHVMDGLGAGEMISRKSSEHGSLCKA